MNTIYSLFKNQYQVLLISTDVDLGIGSGNGNSTIKGILKALPKHKAIPGRKLLILSKV